MFITQRRSIKNAMLYKEQRLNKVILKNLRRSFFKVKKRKAIRTLNCYSSKINFKGRAIIKDTCFATGRSRALTSVNLSRMQVRKFAALGCLIGIKKFY